MFVIVFVIVRHVIQLSSDAGYRQAVQSSVSRSRTRDRSC
jgi:hypothetical protein